MGNAEKKYRDNDGCVYTYHEIFTYHNLLDDDENQVISDDEFKKLLYLPVGEKINLADGFIERIS